MEDVPYRDQPNTRNLYYRETLFQESEFSLGNGESLARGLYNIQINGLGTSAKTTANS